MPDPILTDPIVITLNMEGIGWGWYCEQQRATHFPAERNRVPVHITMFHRLPGEDLPRIAQQASRSRWKPPASIYGITATTGFGSTPALYHSTRTESGPVQPC